MYDKTQARRLCYNGEMLFVFLYLHITGNSCSTTTTTTTSAATTSPSSPPPAGLQERRIEEVDKLLEDNQILSEHLSALGKTIVDIKPSDPWYDVEWDADDASFFAAALPTAAHLQRHIASYGLKYYAFLKTSLLKTDIKLDLNLSLKIYKK